MKAFIIGIGRAMADHPDEIRVSEVDGKRQVVLEMRCHPEDMGRLIGKSGRTINAMRTLLETMAAKQKRKALLEIVEYGSETRSTTD